MKLRKLMAVTLIAAMAGSLAGCVSTDDSREKEAKEEDSGKKKEDGENR